MRGFRRSLRRLSYVSAAVAVGVATIAISQATGRPNAIPVIPSFTPAQLTSVPNGNWVDFGGNNTADRYSALNQINTGNVASLHTAWHIHTGSTIGPGRSQSAGGGRL